MKHSRIAVLATALMLALAVSAQNPADLPSAPSATRQQTPAAAPAVPPPAPPNPARPPAAAPDPASRPNAPAQPAAQPEPEKTAPQHTTRAALGAAVDVENEPLTTITKRVDEVSVIFTVTDKRGHFIKDLTEKDFSVRDDNKPPRQVVSFSRETNLPLRVGLLVDHTNSIRDRFRFEQEAAAEFLSQTIRPKSDLGFVIGFDTTPELTADFTDNTELLGRGVRMLRPGGGTAMYDAIYYACRDKLMKAPQKGPVRRAIILISDGEDNQSRVSREETIEMAQRAEVIIYAISTNTSGIKLRGDKVLERMAEATGGRAFFPFRLEDVSHALAQIQDELRSQYAIAYKPADFAFDGRYRAIEIVAENHKNLKVRARRGYYAPRQ